MPEFKNREEYERWKASRIKTSEKKEKNKYGWGGVVLFLIYAKSMGKAYDTLTSGLSLLGLAFLLTFYFWLRIRLIGKCDQLYKVSFAAGVISLMVTGTLVGATQGIVDKFQMESEIKGYLTELNKKTMLLEQKEKEVTKKFIIEPISETDISHNLTNIDESTRLINERVVLVNDFIKFLRKISAKKNNKVPISEIDELQLLANKGFELAQKSNEMLSLYYKTGDKNALDNYEKLFQEKEILQKEMKTKGHTLIEKL